MEFRYIRSTGIYIEISSIYMRGINMDKEQYHGWLSCHGDVSLRSLEEVVACLIHGTSCDVQPEQQLVLALRVVHAVLDDQV